jgi:hypothetical protein
VQDLEKPLADGAAADKSDAMFHMRLSFRSFFEE